MSEMRERDGNDVNEGISSWREFWKGVCCRNGKFERKWAAGLFLAFQLEQSSFLFAVESSMQKIEQISRPQAFPLYSPK